MKPVSGSTSPAASEPTMLVRVDERGQLERALLMLLPRVRVWLYRLLGPHGPLDDATQDCMVALASALPRFEGRSSMETFAHRIAVRVAYRYYKRAPLATAVESERVLSPEPTPEASAYSEELLAKLHRCLFKLSPRRRTAFVLCAIEGLSPAEAAELEGTSEGSMRARYMHARDDLARMLGSLYENGERR